MQGSVPQLQPFSVCVCDQLSSCQLPQEMLTPVFLNSALSRALQLSASAEQQHADNLSFALRYTPDFFRHNGESSDFFRHNGESSGFFRHNGES